jgi:hypothetical protein
MTKMKLKFEMVGVTEHKSWMQGAAIKDSTGCLLDPKIGLIIGTQQKYTKMEMGIKMYLQPIQM